MKKKASKKGFTIMEMLIVVAIIAVLVAIAIPTFNGALEKSKEAADVANVRAAYAELQVAILTDNAPAVTAIGNEGSTTKTDFAFYLGGEKLNYFGRLSYDNATKKIKYDTQKLNSGNDYTWEVGTTDIHN